MSRVVWNLGIAMFADDTKFYETVVFTAQETSLIFDHLSDKTFIPAENSSALIAPKADQLNCISPQLIPNWIACSPTNDIPARCAYPYHLHFCTGKEWLSSTELS